MSKYKVYFYWGMWNPDSFQMPDEIVEVEAPEGTLEVKIKIDALKKLGSYPKTYAVRVEKVDE